MATFEAKRSANFECNLYTFDYGKKKKINLKKKAQKSERYLNVAFSLALVGLL